MAILKPFCHTKTTFVSSWAQEELYREELCKKEVVLREVDALNDFKLSCICNN